MSPADLDHLQRIYTRLDQGHDTMVSHGEDIASLKTLNEQQMETLKEIRDFQKNQPNICANQLKTCQQRFVEVDVRHNALLAKLGKFENCLLKIQLKQKWVMRGIIFIVTATILGFFQWIWPHMFGM